MAYICEHCGAHLDPGEKCDCQREDERLKAAWQRFTREERHGQMIFITIDDRKGVCRYGT